MVDQALTRTLRVGDQVVVHQGHIGHEGVAVGQAAALAAAFAVAAQVMRRHVPAGGIQGGDFESAVPGGPNSDNAVIVADPMQKGNHVACITGPDEMSFDLPLSLPAGTEEATISLRLLHPMSSKLIRFEDGRTPEGIRLRVRLVNDIGNSAIRDAVVRPIGQWRELEFAFYDLPKKVVSAKPQTPNPKPQTPNPFFCISGIEVINQI